MNCYQALAEHGKVIIADSILPEHPGNENATRTAIHFDAIMLAHIPCHLRSQSDKPGNATPKITLESTPIAN